MIESLIAVFPFRAIVLLLNAKEIGSKVIHDLNATFEWIFM